MGRMCRIPAGKVIVERGRVRGRQPSSVVDGQIRKSFAYSRELNGIVKPDPHLSETFIQIIFYNEAVSK